MSFIARRALPVLSALIFIGTAAGNAGADPFTVLESGPDGVVLEYRSGEPRTETVDTPYGSFQEISMPGHLAMQDAGKPGLPIHGAGLALPDGTRPRMTFEILESATLPGIRPLPARLEEKEPDPSVYAGGGVYPAEPITFQDLGHLRHHRVGQVSVRPLQYDAGAGSLTRIVRAVIRVRFDRDPGSLAASGPALPVGPEPSWEDTYRRVFLNYDAARLFRSRPAPAAAAEKARTAAGGGGQTEFRVYVEMTGIYTITFSRLSAAGWPDGIPVNQIRYYEKRVNNANPSQPIERDIPIRVEEGETGTAGVFDGDDVFYVYGQGFEDRFHPRIEDSRYTNLHTYWVSWSEAGGARMSLTPGWHEADTFARPTSFFQWTHYEEDRVYIFFPPPEGATAGEPPPVDTHYWLAQTAFRDSLPFDTFGREAGTKARIRANWQGITGNAHYLTVWLTRNCTSPEDTLLVLRPQFGGISRYAYDSGLTLPAARFADGCNRLKIQGNGFDPLNPESPGSGALFNSFDVGYFRKYEARDSRLRFTTGGATGDVELTVRGLRQRDLYVFDVTDSLNTAFVDLSGAEITQLSPPPSPEYQLRFRVTAAGSRTYEIYTAATLPDLALAVRPGHFPPAVTTSVLVRDDGVDVAADTGDDVLLISPPQFRAEAQRLADHRQTQGHRVRVVSPQDIWNQFSGGDKSVPAVQSWLRWTFREWSRPPEFVLFFGDASEDYRNDLSSSKPDWVSTWMAFAPETLGGQQELISNDNYFVGPLAPGDNNTNTLPDMHIGRLSVGSVEEARDIVDKLIAYDDYGPDDTWRNRGLVFSDDIYSNPLRGLESYCYTPENRAFERGADSVRVELSRGACVGNFSLEEFRLSDYLDTLQAIPRHFVDHDCPDLSATRAYSIQNLRPDWLSMSARGHLFQIYAGHANRTVMTSENVVQFNGNFISPENRTVEQLANNGRPFIFIGIACHLNQFHAYDEQVYQYSLAERMVLLPRAGAIASIASSGYENTSNCVPVEQAFAHSLFTDLPLDPLTERPRRILGEGKDLALLKLAMENATRFQNLFQSYILLGDPTMPIDMAPPRLAVTAAGAPVSSGAFVTAEPGGSTLRITARISDDVTNGVFSIRDDSTTVPADRLTVTPVTDGNCPASLVRYTADVTPATYAITLTARDWIGRPVDFPLNVRLDVEYRVNGIRLTPGQEAPLDGVYEVRITSPAPLSADRIAILVNGEAGIFTAASVDGSDRVFAATNLRELPGGPVRLSTLIDGVTARSAGALLDVIVQTEVTVREVYFYPNPWEGGGEAFFTYQLSYRAAERPRRATVSVFSVSGRKLASLEAPVELGRNRLDWNVRDREGGEIANGVYLWKLSIESADGPALTRIERLVVHR